jgi:predicted transcriptional regulator
MARQARAGAAPDITEAESQVMAVVWDGAEAGGGGAGAEAILAATGPPNGWSESTVRTLIHRLIRKGALRSERRRGIVVYAPQVTRAAWVSAESQGLLDRVFGGRLAALVAHFAEAKGLDPEAVARLRRLVGELDAEAADED